MDRAPMERFRGTASKAPSRGCAWLFSLFSGSIGRRAGGPATPNLERFHMADVPQNPARKPAPGGPKILRKKLLRALQRLEKLLDRKGLELPGRSRWRRLVGLRF